MSSAKEIEAFGNLRPSWKASGQPPNNEQSPQRQFQPYRPTSIYHEDIPDVAPPSYGEVMIENDTFSGGANVTTDGRINVNINSASLRFAEFLAPSIRHQLADSKPGRPMTIHKSKYADEPPAYIPPGLGPSLEGMPPPQMNVVIQIVGSRGDVQPFVALGKVLKDAYKHRVRIATHANFQKFVEENGLEFFCIGGDPAELMAFMVKNPGLIPGIDALTTGEIGRRRKGISQMIEGSWRSCFEPGDGTGKPLRPCKKGESAPDAAFELSGRPFVADVIIANPPSFAHIHLAEKLGIPLHLMFTMPWSPTRAFPHPLANIQSSNTVDIGTTNTITYALVEMLTWQGLADVINRFRENTLELQPLDMAWTPGLVNRLQIPYTYCWSPALIQKPNDWGQNIDISGFFMLNLASNYTPPPDLDAFLKAGPPPVYIGFGSIVVDDPNALTNLIFTAVRMTGVRALVSKGWGGLGGDSLQVPENVFMLGNCPHDWLFKHVSAVVHHGGAGTSSAGIHAGVPTVVVPFFGDQPFWGAMIARAGAGPDPIPFPKLTVERLAEALRFCMRDDIKAKAEALGAKIREEKGTEKGAEYFHKHLHFEDLRCAVVPSKAAVWRTRHTNIRLSAMAAVLLVRENIVRWEDLKLYRARDYNTEAEPWEPVSGVTAGLIGDFASMTYAVADLPLGVIKAGFKKNKNGKKSDQNSGTATPITPNGAMSPGARKETDILPVSPIPAGFANRPFTASSSITSTSSKPTEPFSPPPSSSTDSKSPEFLRECSMTSTSTNSYNSLTDKGKGVEREQVSRHAVLEASIEAGRGLGRIFEIGAKSPMNFTMGLAKGFRNAPKLYNDPTVREAEKVTGLRSGLKVAGKEFGLGFYDGVAGLVRNPYEGAKAEGQRGFWKGVGKGLGGLLLKPASAIWALPAYTFQGVYLQMKGLGTKSYEAYIIASRMAQGQEDLMQMTPTEEQEMIVRFRAFEQEACNKKKSKVRSTAVASNSIFIPRPSTSTSANSSSINLAGLSRNGSGSGTPELYSHRPSQVLAQQARHEENWSSFYRGDEKARLATAEAEANRNAAYLAQTTTSSSAGPSGFYTAAPDGIPPRISTQSPPIPDSMIPPHWIDLSPSALDQAISETIRLCSRGDTHEDAIIEQILRENVSEMQRVRTTGYPGDRTSIVENMSAEEYQERLERVINQHTAPRRTNQGPAGGSVTNDDLDREVLLRIEEEQAILDARAREEEEEEIKRALQASMQTVSPCGNDSDADDELARVLEESKRAAMKKEEEERAQDERDQILLEYIKQESLAMEEFRRRQRRY